MENDKIINGEKKNAYKVLFYISLVCNILFVLLATTVIVVGSHLAKNEDQQQEVVEEREGQQRRYLNDNEEEVPYFALYSDNGPYLNIIYEDSDDTLHNEPNGCYWDDLTGSGSYVIFRISGLVINNESREYVYLSFTYKGTTYQGNNALVMSDICFISGDWISRYYLYQYTNGSVSTKVNDVFLFNVVNIVETYNQLHIENVTNYLNNYIDNTFIYPTDFTSFEFGGNGWDATMYFDAIKYEDNVFKNDAGSGNTIKQRKVDCTFFSNGRIYDQIAWTCDICYVYQDSNGVKHTFDNATNQVFCTLAYRRYGSGYTSITTDLGGLSPYGEYDIVCRAKILTQEWVTLNNTTNLRDVYLPEEEPYWINDSYKSIEILSRDLDKIPFPYSSGNILPIENITLREYLGLGYREPSYYMNVNGTTDVGLGQSFTLISQAFSVWLTIFNIQVIPGLTIGLLFFIPLIVTIIIVILRLVKK